MSVIFLRQGNFGYDCQPFSTCVTTEESEGPHVTGDIRSVAQFHPECLIVFHSDFFQISTFDESFWA